jgi:hypothetical protein
MAKEDGAARTGQTQIERIIGEQQQHLDEASRYSLELQRKIETRTAQYEEVGARLVKFENRVREKQTVAHRVSVDLGAGTVASVSTELINWGVRAVGEWSGNGYFARNVDLLQSLPHFLIGLTVYIAEVATRGGKLPSMRRELVSEFGKLFATLGFANLIRVLRGRMAESKQKSLSYEQLAKDKAALEAKLASLGGQP